MQQVLEAAHESKISAAHTMDSEPPFLESWKTILQAADNDNHKNLGEERNEAAAGSSFLAEERGLPLIDLSQLSSRSKEEVEECKRNIVEASRRWGFFQVFNHGMPIRVLKSMQHEQMKLFRQPFHVKARNFLNLPPNTYRWGNPAATCKEQLLWSEAFQLPVADISRINGYETLRSTMEALASGMNSLAENIAEILAEDLGVASTTFFRENCTRSSCHLRMNRYPPCRDLSSEVYGFIPHTDSGFLTILYQDQVGGLQLVEDDTWFSVQPIPDTLVVNIGDSFQAWSNDVYKSVKHRVIGSKDFERFSVGYFYCPSYDTVIENCISYRPSVYRKFSFRDYRQQVQKDLEATGDKVGLPRFLL